VKFFVFIAAAGLLFPQAKSQPKGTVQRIKVHGKPWRATSKGTRRIATFPSTCHLVTILHERSAIP
jgi:hypothetical protein